MIFNKIQNKIRYKILKNFKLSFYAVKLRRYKNKYKGETCFFIGNGPSLTVEDLEKIQSNNIPTFAFNRIYKIFPNTSWRPTFYVSQDDKVLKTSSSKIDKINCENKFIPINARWYQGINMKNINWFYLYSDNIDFKEYIKFSKKIDECIYNSNTVMYTATQLAAYMGFKEIYLIGVDHSFSVYTNNAGEIIKNTKIKDYFCKEYNKDKDKLYIPNLDASTFTYESMKFHCEKLGIKIYNATRGGKLEVFYRVDFDEIFK